MMLYSQGSAGLDGALISPQCLLSPFSVFKVGYIPGKAQKIDNKAPKFYKGKESLLQLN